MSELDDPLRTLFHDLAGQAPHDPDLATTATTEAAAKGMVTAARRRRMRCGRRVASQWDR